MKYLFYTQVMKSEALSKQYGVLCDLLSMRQYLIMTQNTASYSALAIRAMEVSKKAQVREAAELLLHIYKQPILTREQAKFDEQLDACILDIKTGKAI